MGCTGSTNAMIPPASDINRPISKNGANSETPPPAIAFEVPLMDEQNSLIKKHPPKRLLKLEDKERSPPPLTHEMLLQKLAQAEQRRIQILNERIKSAKSLMKPKCANGNGMKINGATTMIEAPRMIDVEG